MINQPRGWKGRNVGIQLKRMGLAALMAGTILVTACTATPAPGGGPFSRPQVAALQKAGFDKTDRGWEFSVSDKLLFATDKAEVLPGQVTAIRRVTQALIGVGIRHVEVEGHTDGTGTVRYNDALSVKRASAVADAMIAAGMPRENVKVVGLGERYPVESNATAAGRAENRRVVMLITAP